MISIVTVILTVGAGVLIWAVDRQHFPSVGEGMWWAVQTLTTVGYGDLVPGTTPGRLIGTLVMLNGIAFLTVITAAVTALLVEQMRRRGGLADEAEAPETAVVAALDDINSRLDAIEASLAPRRDGP
jgi:voltage-gated potassium channel